MQNADSAQALRDALLLTGFTILLVFSLDAAIFRTGAYLAVLEPNSYAGHFLAAVRNARAVQSGGTKPILLLGDSRMNEGFSAKIADGLAGGLRFVNAAVPGSSLRTWYYILRAADPGRDRYSGIVVPLDDFDD